MGDDDPAAARTAKLQFHYIKGASYREICCDGALGGLTPQGGMWMALFAERGAIPRLVEFEVPAKEGEDTVEFEEGAHKPSRIETRNGIIRHVEFTAYMSVETAKRIHKWLGENLARHGEKSGT